MTIIIWVNAIVQYSAGKLTTASAPITHAFAIVNASATPETIDHLQPSCGCTSAWIAPTTAGAANRLPILKPGSTLTVRVTVNPADLQPGSFDKVVWVFAQGHKAPIAALHMIGTCVAATAFGPRQIALGTVQAGTPASAAFSLTVDKSLFSEDHPPQVTTDDPDLTVTADPAQPLAPPPAANTETFHYHVSLSPTAALGRITAHLAVVGKDPSLDDPGASAIVTGEVRGRISATPEVIAFGSVTQGTARQQQVLLSVPAELVAGLTVETSSPELTASVSVPKSLKGSAQAFANTPNAPPLRGGQDEGAVLAEEVLSPSGTGGAGGGLLALPLRGGQDEGAVLAEEVLSPSGTGYPLGAAGGGLLVTLTVTLSADAPAGPVEGTVIVHDSDGERLAMAVYGVVMSTPSG